MFYLWKCLVVKHIVLITVGQLNDCVCVYVCVCVCVCEKKVSVQSEIVPQQSSANKYSMVMVYFHK